MPRWIWNAHHAMFDDAWLAELLAANGFTDIDITATTSATCAATAAGHEAEGPAR